MHRVRHQLFKRKSPSTMLYISQDSQDDDDDDEP
jgi:hypothetical protein